MHPLHQSRKTKSMIAVIVVLAAIWWWNPLRIADALRGGVQWALQPVVQVGYRAGTTLRSGADLVTRIGSLYEENQRLHVRVRELESAQARADDCLRDNAILHTELDMAQRRAFDVEAANVILRDAIGGRQWIMIDKGSADGITSGAPVVVRGDVLIGRVSDVQSHTARVDLLTHPSSVITVTGSRSGAEAIARGNHGLALIVEDLPKDARVENGEMFVTSHLAERIPPGLTVGTLHNIAPSADSLFQIGALIPVVTTEEMRAVFVVT